MSFFIAGSGSRHTLSSWLSYNLKEHQRWRENGTITVWNTRTGPVFEGSAQEVAKYFQGESRGLLERSSGFIEATLTLPPETVAAIKAVNSNGKPSSSILRQVLSRAVNWTMRHLAQEHAFYREQGKLKKAESGVDYAIMFGLDNRKREPFPAVNVLISKNVRVRLQNGREVTRVLQERPIFQGQRDLKSMAAASVARAAFKIAGIRSVPDGSTSMKADVEGFEKLKPPVDAKLFTTASEATFRARARESRNGKKAPVFEDIEAMISAVQEVKLPAFSEQEIKRASNLELREKALFAAETALLLHKSLGTTTSIYDLLATTRQLASPEIKPLGYLTSAVHSVLTRALANREIVELRSFANGNVIFGPQEAKQEKKLVKAIAGLIGKKSRMKRAEVGAFLKAIPPAEKGVVERALLSKLVVAEKSETLTALGDFSHANGGVVIAINSVSSAPKGAEVGVSPALFLDRIARPSMVRELFDAIRAVGWNKRAWKMAKEAYTQKASNRLPANSLIVIGLDGVDPSGSLAAVVREARRHRVVVALTGSRAQRLFMAAKRIKLSLKKDVDFGGGQSL